MFHRMLEFYRCPANYADSEVSVPVESFLASALLALSHHHPEWATKSRLASDACEHVIESLLMERYEQAQPEGLFDSPAIQRIYYFARPLLGVSIRRWLQKLALRSWNQRTFPTWPIDRTVDYTNEQLLIAAMKLKGVDRVPFIWFWPEGRSAAVMMTHDVETAEGLAFCPKLMKWDQSYGVKTSFQIVPEERYRASDAQLQFIRSGGFEVNLHDFNHDGLLFKDKKNFLDRVHRINAYAREFGARGFRAGALYRNQEWFESFEFEYDMSVPNVAHLDPQRGGCCTIFPYFVGKILELPVTMIQDYSLFHILDDYSTSIWKNQLRVIRENNGLAAIITHPDYLFDPPAQQTYHLFLAHLAEQRRRENLWIALPGEVNDWWRQRSRMELKLSDGRWEISGEGSSRARVAYAEMSDKALRYTFEPDFAKSSGFPRRENQAPVLH